MTYFSDIALPFVLDQEGGYSDDPEDKGGATMHGITQATYDAWRKFRGQESQPVKKISDFEVSSIYATEFWNKAGCQTLPDAVGLVVFDAAVQHGPAKSVKFLQEALGVDADGKCGAKTLEAIREEAIVGRLDELIEDCLRLRVQFYDGIVQRDPAQKKFHKGWMNRITALRETALPNSGGGDA